MPNIGQMYEKAKKTLFVTAQNSDYLDLCDDLIISQNAIYFNVFLQSFMQFYIALDVPKH